MRRTDAIEFAEDLDLQMDPLGYRFNDQVGVAANLVERACGLQVGAHGFEGALIDLAAFQCPLQ